MLQERIEDTGANDRVLHEMLVFSGFKRARLEQDRLPDADLAHIMQFGTELDELDVRVAHTQLPSYPA